jgi:FtsP/CotA-like multicopper oxidase with cupredoxin domain
MSGLAGFYLLRDKADTIAPLLPQGKYDVPIVLQDRTFKTDGNFWFPTVGTNPTVHPYWVPMFYGNTAMINGLAWPNMNVNKGQYMFRLLDGSNARFYTVSFTVASTGAKLPFVQIASDGGYLRSPVTMTSLAMAPGERATVLVDFSSLAAGTKVIMTNSGNGCGGGGMGGGGMGMMAPSLPQLMQFTVGSTRGPAVMSLPKILNKDLQAYPSLSNPEVTRVLTLTSAGGMGMMNSEAFLCDGQKWMAPVSEMPCLGSTEVWQFVNPTMMAHPMHLHLVQFQVVSRQTMDCMSYYSAWTSVNGAPPLDHPTIPVAIGPYLTGSPTAAPANEQGWKDTVKCYPGQVTTVIVRFAPIDGSMEYPFDAMDGPGYVWHCHIIDHEDNEMMRPDVIMLNPFAPTPANRLLVEGRDY